MFARFNVFQAIVFGALIILGLGLFQLQVLEGPYYRTLSEKNRIRLIPTEAPRGRVFGRNGKLLATNRSSYDVVAIPEDMTRDGRVMLSKMLDIPQKEILKRLRDRREYPFAPAIIQKDISRELAFKIEERRPELPGVAIRVSGTRFYPYEETASHIIGYIGKINRDEYLSKDRKQFGMRSSIGRSGIERTLDDRLRGWRGGKQIEVNSRGQLIRVLSEKKPEPGEDIYTTIDLEFQKRVMEQIEGKHASVALIDLETDGLIVMASSPGFDPNIFVSPSESDKRMKVLRDPEAPLLDRGLHAAYPPGSVFKLVTALSALEAGKITPGTRFMCRGHFRLNSRSRKFHCWNKRGHGNLNLKEAIERSCNVYFFNLGKILSPEQIAKTAKKFGFAEALGIEIEQRTPGLIPDSKWKKERYKENWYGGETLNMAIGQGYVLTSPLQILKMTAIIAKDGGDVFPHLLKENDRPVSKKRIDIPKEYFAVLKAGMFDVVESDLGTGQLARVDFMRVGGKTGTAQATGDSHSWMSGFFPFQNPKIAFVVFVEHGGPGGITGAKLVKEILKIWQELQQESENEKVD